MQPNDDEPRHNPALQDELGREPLNVSLFELFRDAFSSRLTPLRATKLTLVDISHSVEELVLADHLPSMIFTGFQMSSHWRKEAARYLELAGIVHSMSIFAGGMPPEAPGSNYIHVNLAYDDRLRQEWFLLILTQRFSVLLCGRDRLEDVPDEAHRAFDTLWTFEPDLITDLAGILARVVQHYRPERHQTLIEALAQFPPVQPDGRYVTLLTSRVVNHLERQYTRQQAQTEMVTPDQRIDTALLPLFSHTYLLLLLGKLTEARLDEAAAKVVTDMLGFRARYLVVDISKVESLEPNAATRLVRMVRELHVCGITVMLTGMTAHLAQVFVEQNLDGHITNVYPTLEEGCAAVLSLQNSST